MTGVAIEVEVKKSSKKFESSKNYKIKEKCWKITKVSKIQGVTHSKQKRRKNTKKMSAILKQKKKLGSKEAS